MLFVSLSSSLACSIRIPQRKIHESMPCPSAYLTWDHCFTSNMNHDHEVSTGSKGTSVYSSQNLFWERQSFFAVLWSVYPIVCYEICDYMMDFFKASEKQLTWPMAKLSTFWDHMFSRTKMFELLFQGPLAKWGKPQNMFELMVENWFWVWRLESNLKIKFSQKNPWRRFLGRWKLEVSWTNQLALRILGPSNGRVREPV